MSQEGGPQDDPVGQGGPPDPLGNGKTASASDKADQILRELVNSASSVADIKAILVPVQHHMDDHQGNQIRLFYSQMAIFWDLLTKKVFWLI